MPPILVASALLPVLGGLGFGFFSPTPAPPPPPPPGMFDALQIPAPALLSISLLATILVMFLGSWALAPRESAKPELSLAASGGAAASAAKSNATDSAAEPATRDKFSAFDSKMRQEGCSSTAIAAFK